MLTKFKAFPDTAVPEGFGDWKDISWSMDGCASMMLPCPTREWPKANLVMWVDQTGGCGWRYLLEHWPDEFAGDERLKVLYIGNDMEAAKAASAKALRYAVKGENT